MKDLLSSNMNKSNGQSGHTFISVQHKKIVPIFPQNGSPAFADKVVVITGASSGIGRALSFYFSSQGARVVLAARNHKKLKEIGAIISNNGGECYEIPTDVTKHHDCYYLIEKTLDVFGGIDILINNAGISMRASFNEVDLHVLESLMNTNFWGAVYCTKYALPYLLESGGSLIAISSISGITPLPGRTGYVASKHALDGFMDTVRVEHMEDELHVLSVHPGFTTSNIRNTALNKDGKEQRETPRDEDKMMSAETVAVEVGKAILAKKRDIVLTWEGKLITWLYKHAPNVSDRLIHWEMSKEVGSPF